MRIPIVNEQDEIIDYKERENRNPDDLIRATGLGVSDKDGNILLARRSFSKKYDKGLWGPAVSGTVEEGETYESNIIKEASEEIGLIGIKINKGNKIRVHFGFILWFHIVIDHDYKFVKQDEEVEEIKWFSKNELEKLVEEKPDIFVKNFKKYLSELESYENQN